MDTRTTRSRPPSNGGNGRPKGALNHSTRDVREAIAELARNNIDKLQAWLDSIAKDDPARAAELFLRALE